MYIALLSVSKSSFGYNVKMLVAVLSFCAAWKWSCLFWRAEVRFRLRLLWHSIVYVLVYWGIAACSVCFCCIFKCDVVGTVFCGIFGLLSYTKTKTRHNPKRSYLNIHTDIQITYMHTDIHRPVQSKQWSSTPLQHRHYYCYEMTLK